MTTSPTLVAPRAVPLYVGGGALSLFGNSAIGIVLPWLVISRTGDLSTTGLVATIAGLAAVPASLLGGRLADRFGARRVAVAADLGSALAVAALPIVDSLWGLGVAWFVVLGAAGAVFDVPGMTARQALLADVARVGGTKVDTVAGLYQTAFSVSFLAGPALAGVLLSVLDPVQVVWVTAACSASAALLTLAVPVAEPTHAWGHDGSAGGWTVLRRDRRLVATLVIASSAAFATPPLLSVILPGHFAAMGEPGGFGAVVSMFAVGTLAGSIAYAVVARSSRLLAYVIGIGAMVTGFALLAPLGGVVAIGIGMAVMGLGSGMYGPVWNVFVAEQVDERVRARVLSWMNAVALVAGPAGLGVMTLVLQHTGIETVAFGIAALWVLVGAYAVLSPSARGVATAEREVARADDR